jgi:hypothetical protein
VGARQRLAWAKASRGWGGRLDRASVAPIVLRVRAPILVPCSGVDWVCFFHGRHLAQHTAVAAAAVCRWGSCFPRGA